MVKEVINLSKTNIKKLIFVVERMGQFKWFSPLIDEALLQGHYVECLLDQRDISKTTKWYERPELNLMPKFRYGEPVFSVFKGEIELQKKLEEIGPGLVFLDRPPKFKKRKGQIWLHIVTSYYDSFAGMLPKELLLFDLIFCSTTHWVDASIKFYEISGRAEVGSPELEELRSRTRTTGVPQFDHFKILDRDSAKERLGIPIDKKVVTVYALEPGVTFWATYLFQVPNLLMRLFYILVLPFSYPRFFTKIGRSKILEHCWYALIEKPAFLWAAFMEPTDLDIMKKIREFCDKNGYFFVIKYRKKYKPLSYQLGIADLEILEDTEFYPYTSAITIAASDILISTFSTSMGEAAFWGIPGINLHPDNLKIQIYTQFRLTYKNDEHRLSKAFDECVHDLREGAFYNTPGVIYDMTFRQFHKKFSKQTLDDYKIDEKKAKEYRRKYIQHTPEPSAPRIIEQSLYYWDCLFAEKSH